VAGHVAAPNHTLVKQATPGAADSTLMLGLSRYLGVPVPRGTNSVHMQVYQDPICFNFSLLLPVGILRSKPWMPLKLDKPETHSEGASGF
jgi:hypothetical protein